MSERRVEIAVLHADAAMAPPNSGAAPDHLPEWQVVENAVAAVQAVIGRDAGWTVVPNAHVSQVDSEERRQVDVYLECPSGPAKFRVGIDVKDEKRPLDIVKVEQLCMKGKRLQLDRYVIVSTSGFSEEAKKLALRERVSIASVEKNAASKIFGDAKINAPKIWIHEANFEFPEHAEHPPDDRINGAWIEDFNVCWRVEEVPNDLACAFVSSTSTCDDRRFIVRGLLDLNGTTIWHHRGDKWPGPTAITVDFSFRNETVTGLVLQMEDGRHVMAAIAKYNGRLRQFTLVQNECSESASTVSMHMSDVRSEIRQV